MIFWLRWFVVIPTGVLAALVVMLPVHWLVLLVTAGDNEGIGLGLLAPRTLERLAIAFSTPLSLVYFGAWTAPASPYFTGLLESTARRFALGDVTADKAYLSHNNTAAVVAMGGTPFIPFKTNTVPVTGDSPWARMYHYFAFNREAFLAHYHQRSNVETTFSMVKGKFGDSVRSKSDRGQVNEVLCKMLAHNICVVIKAMETFGLQANFCAEAPVAQKVAS